MIGVRDLRADLAAHVRRAAGGQRVVISIAGRAAAQLGPLQPEHGGRRDLADLIAVGAVLAPRRETPARQATPIPIWSGVRLDRALKELRG